jgi:D-alanine-D-alanine ligase
LIKFGRTYTFDPFYTFGNQAEYGQDTLRRHKATRSTIPYTGSSTDAIYTTSNKLLTKKLLMGAGIATPEYLTMENHGQYEIVSGESYIIKSVWEHASMGIDDESIISIKEPQKLFYAVMRRKEKLGGECFAERYIEGREFNLSMLTSGNGPVVLPPAEIRFDKYPAGKVNIVDYRAKWIRDSFEYNNTRRSFEFEENDQSLLESLEDIAIRCWHLFGLGGYARVDFRVDKENRPWVLEVNANPCISPDAGFAAAAFCAGLNFSEIINRIINDTVYFEQHCQSMSYVDKPADSV